MKNKDKKNHGLRKEYGLIGLENDIFQQYLDLAEVMIVDLNTDQTVRSINQKTAAVLGYPKTEIIGKNWFDSFLPSRIRNQDRTVFVQLISGETTPAEYFENPVITKRGEERIIAWHYKVIADKNGTIIGTLNSGTDITDRKLADDALRKTHKLYQEAISQGDAVPYMLDFANRKYIFIGDRIQELIGFSPEEMDADVWNKIVIDTILRDNKNGWSVAEAKKRSLAGELNKWRADLQVRTRTNELRWIADSSILLCDSQNKPTGTLGLLQDITDRKLAEKKLQETHALYRQAITQAGAVPYIHDHATHTFPFIGDGIYQLTGYNAKEFNSLMLHQMIQKSVMFGEFAGLSIKEAVQRTRTDAFKKWRADYLIKTKTGELKWLADSAIEIRDEKGVAYNSIGILQDITDRKKAEETLQDNYNQVRRALEGTVRAIAETVEKRDPYTAGHQRGVAKLAEAIALEMQLPKEQVEGIRVAATLHDIGKMYVPAEILAKPTKLTEIEFGLVKIHAESGFDILKGIDFPWPIAQIVLQHHERLDGSGYPSGLTADKIGLEARIIAVADVVEAMCSHRPYRPKLGIEPALAELEKNQGKLYDPKVVETCVLLFREKGFSF
jgi:PAS domain S-box-containing protein/putative nucleotidyltransferase with HDIG domain